jgi:hypothetical protein
MPRIEESVDSLVEVAIWVPAAISDSVVATWGTICDLRLAEIFIKRSGADVVGIERLAASRAKVSS